MFSEKDISEMINTVKRGVEKSELGPMFITNAEGQQLTVHASFNTFITIIQCVCPKSSNKHEMELRDKPEGWQQ